MGLESLTDINDSKGQAFAPCMGLERDFVLLLSVENVFAHTYMEILI